MVAAQDCDLSWAPGDTEACCIEIRPVHSERPPQEWGIRSSKFLLTPDLYLDSQSPRPLVSPLLLSELAKESHTLCLMPTIARAAKTWLGLRYDRPAVPGIYVPIHMKLAEEVTKKSRRDKATFVRDILVRYIDTESGGLTYELIAVLPELNSPGGEEAAEDTPNIEAWLTEIAMAIPPDLGVASRLDALPADRVSISFLEQSYAVDSSAVSWPRGGGPPVGVIR